MKNPWIAFRILIPAAVFHLCLGSLYAWSVFSKHLQHIFGLHLTQVQLAFSIAVFVNGLAAAVGGSLAVKWGPRRGGWLATALFVTGMLGSAWAIEQRNIWLLYACYGVLFGCGVGVGYVTPMSMLAQWFPNRRGAVTGFCIMGFGLGSMVAGPVFNLLIDRYGVVSTFLISGAVYMVIMAAMSSLFALPVNRVQTAAAGTVDPQAASVWRRLDFYLIWGMLFFNAVCGLGMIATASPLLQTKIGLSAGEAAAVVGLIGFANAAGRLLMSGISDYAGRPLCYIVLFSLLGAVYFVMHYVYSPLPYKVMLCLVIAGYGGGFAGIVSYLSDVFGSKSLSATHGKVMTAMALAGLVGPQLVAWVYDSTGSYFVLFRFYVTFCVIGLGLAVWQMWRLRGSRASGAGAAG
ncbi:MAG: OFA family MFS transporter [Negativicutes bacterium]|nr:OFA family MFS transporter [Negativicutes bacterium]